MSGLLLQNVAVAVIVLAAAGFLVWRRVRRRARPGAVCDQCPGCAVEPPREAEPTLIEVGEPRARQR